MVKDTVDRGDLKIEWHPTEEMWEGVLTKTKQGKSFRVFRSKLTNVPIDYDDEKEITKNRSEITGVLKHKI